MCTAITQKWLFLSNKLFSSEGLMKKSQNNKSQQEVDTNFESEFNTAILIKHPSKQMARLSVSGLCM
jgi:hypothetical protein